MEVSSHWAFHIVLTALTGAFLRFYESVYVEGMLKRNSEIESLTFLLDLRYWWVYLYGSGVVTTSNGNAMKF